MGLRGLPRVTGATHRSVRRQVPASFRGRGARVTTGRTPYMASLRGNGCWIPVLGKPAPYMACSCTKRPPGKGAWVTGSPGGLTSQPGDKRRPASVAGEPRSRKKRGRSFATLRMTRDAQRIGGTGLVPRRDAIYGVRSVVPGLPYQGSCPRSGLRGAFLNRLH